MNENVIETINKNVADSIGGNVAESAKRPILAPGSELVVWLNGETPYVVTGIRPLLMPGSDEAASDLNERTLYALEVRYRHPELREPQNIRVVVPMFEEDAHLVYERVYRNALEEREVLCAMFEAIHVRVEREGVVLFSEEFKTVIEPSAWMQKYWSESVSAAASSVMSDDRSPFWDED